ncbi:RHS repeat domain-containing protein, partial [Pseudidiomarina mangrovi]|uniref:RHS repeat domain-containing protein n=1 Tax=Pseudidiomarina mangrovi TaxID=2487133 RepID=UPI00196BAB41
IGHQVNYYYDTYSRMVQKDTVVNGTTYTSRTEFDANYGRVKAIEHASGIKVAYEYDPYGNVLRVKNAGSGFVYQENLQADALQNITQMERNNGTLYENRSYDQVSGQLKRVNASSAMGHELHYLEYFYGSFGNLASQTVYSNNGASSSTESYSYDDLHRLTSSSLTSGGSISYSYDATGNLTQKSDYASSMTYGASGKSNSGNAGPNAVLSATLVGGGSASFTYDNNGNLTSGAGKSITYNAMNKPTQITANGTTVSFSYDANWQRFKKVIGSSSTLYYIDGSVEVELTGGDTITRTYIDDIAVIKRTEHASQALASHEITYTLRDRLGSVVTLTNHNNLIMEHRSYDPFGKPRYGTMQPSSSATLFNVANGTPFTMRGFTDHEHIDEAQLIHMNGRVYDYNLGRFLSVDPFIQSPGNSQSMNPYSYIMNNPLGGTDPSGYLSCQADQTVGECGLEAGGTAEIVDKDGNSLGTASLSEDGKTLKAEGNNGVSSATTAINGQAFTVDVKNTAQIGSQNHVNALSVDDVTVPEKWTPNHLTLADDTDASDLDEFDRKLMYLLDNGISDHIETVDRALKDSSLDDERRKHLEEAQINLRSASFKYSKDEPPLRFAEAGIYKDGTGATVTFYRSSARAMGANGRPVSGYGKKLRLGYGGIKDVVSHEGAHLVRDLVYPRNSEGDYASIKHFDIEQKANEYMEFMRTYDRR